MFRNYTRALRPSISKISQLWCSKSFSTAPKTHQEIEGSEEPAATRFPLSVQAIYYKPLRRLPKYGLPVCDLQLRSFSVRQLDFQCDFALRAAYYLNLPASGPVPLPKKIERWTVPRSNFVHKKSQENYERITYKRLIQIKDGTPDTIELWLAFLKKHAVYGVGTKANVWQFEELGVGKTMNISLENLHDTKRPKWAHFGPRKTPETAAKVRDLLENEQYKPSESEATGPSPGHEEPDTAVPQIPSLPATLKGVKNIEPDMTKEELRLRELEVEVAEAHAKDYLAQAVDEQRKAEERLVETQEALKDGLQESEIQTVEVLKEETVTLPSKVEIQHTEADSTAHPSIVEQQRSEADILRNLELQRALEAKAAAEARAAEESRRTAEFQTSLLAQFAAMQAELAALKAERAAEKMQKYTQPMPAPAPSQGIKYVESEVLVKEPKADPPPIQVGELLPNPESDSVHIPEKLVEEVLRPPEAPAVNKAALLSPESIQSTKAKQVASIEPTEGPLIVETQNEKVSKGVTPALSPPRPGVTTPSPESAVSPSSPLTPVVNEIKVENEREVAKPKPRSIEISHSSPPMPEKPDLSSISESTIEESVAKPTYGVSSIEAPAKEALKVETLTGESSSAEAQTTELPTGATPSEERMVITTAEAFQAEAQQEETYRREMFTEENSPVEPQEAKEASMGTALVEEEGTNAEVQELAPESQSSSSAEYPAPSPNSYNTTGATVEREGELHPGAKIAFGDSEVSDLPLSSRTQGTQGAVQGQPEVTRDEEPAPDKQEKPAVTKDDKPSRS